MVLKFDRNPCNLAEQRDTTLLFCKGIAVCSTMMQTLFLDLDRSFNHLLSLA